MTLQYYAIGQLLTYAATLAFAAIGWIVLDKKKTFDRLAFPFLIAAVVWAVFAFGGVLIVKVILFLVAILGLFGFFLVAAVLWGLVWTLLTFSKYLIPPDRLEFDDDDAVLPFIGLIYVVIFVGMKFSQNPHWFQAIFQN